MSLVARQIEAEGIATVIIGSAVDIFEHCGVPRYLFTDFPLGNPCGHPWQRDMQRDIVRRGLMMLETAAAPRTTAKAPHHWWDTGNWRARYSRVEPHDRGRLQEVGDQRRVTQAEVKAKRR
ncbi:MAG: hypothetical protein AAF709_02550 [Pseudomonadota bacterium]